MSEKKIITPRGNRILVKVIEEKEIRHGNLNLILPDQKDSYGMPHKGEIVAVGDGVDAGRMGFKAGDIVFFSRYNEGKNGVKISVDDIPCVLLNTSDIYGRPNDSWRDYVYTIKEVSEVPREHGASGGDTGADADIQQAEEEYASADASEIEEEVAS